jgi:hypothetical protein
MARRPPFTESAAREAIAKSSCWSDALRELGYEVKGSNHRTLKKYAHLWGIAVDHFDPHIGRKRAAAARAPPLSAVLVANSRYPRGRLKERLYAEGLKRRECETCGQGEQWQGRQMSLVLDHINGVATDHRLPNLRILCPNCAATLDTHCGRSLPRSRVCPNCRDRFAPTHIRHRYCSLRCWGAVRARDDYSGPGANLGIPHPENRKVERPVYWKLLEEIEELGYCGVGRRHGVSDNAIRKWERQYEREMDLGDFSAI